jgi:hypothetical protein
MKTMRRNRLTSQPNAGFTASVTSAVPMNSQRMAASHPYRIARRAHDHEGRKNEKEVEGGRHERRHLVSADVEESVKDCVHGQSASTVPDGVVSLQVRHSHPKRLPESQTRCRADITSVTVLTVP